MSALRTVEASTSWPASWDTFDPEFWPYGRCEWHLARARAAPDGLTKLREIQQASRRLWASDPEAYRAAGYA